MSLHDVAIPNDTPPAVIAFSLAILVVCFVAFSIVYLCKYCFSTVINTWSFHRTSSGSIVRLSPTISPPRGLDPSLLQIYPTFPYSSVKDLHKENYGLECAICLLEFEDHSLLRLLTLCCHVFHQDCIDLWLRSHKTCPVCRRDLDSPSYEMHKTGDVVNHIGDDDVVANIVSLINDEICIDVREGEEGDKGDANVGDKRHQHQHQHQHQHEHDCDHPVSTSVSVQQQEEQMFSRSHSTGHSIVLIREDEGKDIDDDKYTLRLPEHAIRGRHNCTRSCASYKEMARLVAPCSSCGFVQHISGCSSLSHAQKS